MDNDRLTILFVNHSAEDKGGATRALLELVLGLKERYNVKPVVLTPGFGWFTKELRKNGIPCLNAEYGRWLGSETKTGFREIAYLVRLANRIKKNYHPDIVHTNTSVINVGIILGKIMGAKHVWHIRELGEKYFGWNYAFPKKLVSLLYRSSDAVVPISQYVQNEMCNNFKLSDNMALVYDGVSIVDKYVKCKSDRVEFAIVGCINRKKKQFLAVKACRLLLEKGYKNFRLNIIGNGDTSEIIQYVKKYDLYDYVRLHGYCNDVNSLLRDMNVGIVASDFEAFGRTTVEFMGNYMPVIGVNTGATKELVVDNYNGFLFQSGNEKSLAHAMERTINIFNENAEDKFCCNARKIAEEYSLDKHLAQVYALYKTLLANE